MFAKCANPACSAKYRYFHEGKLFATESSTDSQAIGPPPDPEYTCRAESLEYFWLCSSCRRTMTIQPDGHQKIEVVPNPGISRDSSVYDHAQRIA